MENKNQTQFNIDEEAINAFVEKHVRKSQREETAAICAEKIGNIDAYGVRKTSSMMLAPRYSV